MIIKLKFIVLLILISALTGFGQQPADDFLSRSVPEMRMARVGVHQILSRLSVRYRVPIGFEAIPSETPPQPNEVISINIENGTVRDVLNAITEADSRYRWEEVDGVINVFPRERQDEILEVVVREFQVNRMPAARVREAITDLPEVKARLDSLGVSPLHLTLMPHIRDRSLISLNLRNVTVRDILNEIARRSTSRYWVVSKFGDHNEFLIINF